MNMKTNVTTAFCHTQDLVVFLVPFLLFVRYDLIRIAIISVMYHSIPYNTILQSSCTGIYRGLAF